MDSNILIDLGRKVPDCLMLLDAIYAHAQKVPEKTFIQFKDERLSYRALIERSSAFARLYVSRGAEHGDVILISLKTSPSLVCAFFGAIIAGCVPSMMPFPSAKQDSKLFWSSHNTLFRHLGGGLIVTYSENIQSIEQNIEPGLMQVVSTDEVRDHSEGPEVNVQPCAAETLACLQHSSGTTGLKKGIPLTFGEIADQVTSYSNFIGMTQNDVIASWLPLYHDMGFVACLLMPATLGATVVMLDPFEWIIAPVTLFQAISEHGATFTWLPNFAFNHLVNSIVDDRHRVDLSGMKAFINCSEPCKPETFDQFATRFADWGVRSSQLQVCYAMAETVFAVTQTPIGSLPSSMLFQASPNAVPVRLLCAGYPVGDLTIRITDESGRDCQPAELGEICLAGRFVFQGYHKRPVQDPAIFRDGYYVTGDLGLISEGALFVLGRKKDLIIICGKNVFAHDLESLINGINGIKPGRNIAMGVYNDLIGSEDLIVVAEVVPGKNDEAAIRRDVRRVLEGSVGILPKRVILVEDGWLIKSTSGKINRSETKAKFMNAGKI